MAKENTPKMNLIDALNAAHQTDDLDEACKLIQDVLGVTDGSLAGAVFSDLDDDPNSENSWQSMSKIDRCRRLVGYIRSEVNLIGVSDIPSLRA